MIKINKEQSDWLNKYFCLSKKDFPSDFMEPKDMIDDLNGKYHFRGVEYHRSSSDGYSFIDDCLMSALAMPKNKEKFETIFAQVIWLTSECERLEYYELMGNLSEIMNCFKIFAKDFNGIHVDNEVSSVLLETGITKNDSGLPF